MSKKLLARLSEKSTLFSLVAAAAVLFGVPPETLDQAAQLGGLAGIDTASLKTGVVLGMALGGLIGRKEKKTIDKEAAARR